jgi:hypothetical protein
VCVARFDEGEPEHTEAFAADGREQRLFVGEVAVEGRSGNPEARPDRPQGELFDPLAVDRAERLVEQRPPEIAVMVVPGPFAPGPRR